MKKYYFIFLFSLIFASCAGTRDISKENRFQNILGKPIATKVPFIVCKFTYGNYGEGSPFELRNAIGHPVADPDSITLAELPMGSKVVFQSAANRSDIGGTWETLIGGVYVNGHNYPIAYNLGPAGFSPPAWLRIYDDFAVPGAHPAR